jgi:hypothetical protein
MKYLGDGYYFDERGELGIRERYYTKRNDGTFAPVVDVNRALDGVEIGHVICEHGVDLEVECQECERPEATFDAA